MSPLPCASKQETMMFAPFWAPFLVFACVRERAKERERERQTKERERERE